MAAVALLFAAEVVAQQHPDMTLCADNSAGAADSRLAACARVIDAGDPSLGEVASAYFYRGNILKDRGDLTGAIADYDQGIFMAPAEPRLFVNRGALRLRIGQIDRAIADLDEAIRLDPRSTNAYADRAVAWTRKGESDRAIADLDRAIELAPRDPGLWLNRGSVWRSKGNLDRAIADYDAALRLNPRYELARRMREAARLEAKRAP